MSEDKKRTARLLIVDTDNNFCAGIHEEYTQAKAAAGEKKPLIPAFADTVRASQSKLSDRDFAYAGVFVNPALGGPAWLAVVRTSHQFRANVPVFVIYDEPPKISEREASQLGVYGFFKKPITYAKMVALVTGEEESGAETLPEAEAPAATQTPPPPEDDAYLEVELDGLHGRSKSLFELFVKLSNGKYVRVLNAGDVLGRDRIESYRAKGVKALYILKTAQADYLKFYDELVQNVIKDASVSIEVKSAQVAGQGLNMQQILKSSGFSDESLAAAQVYVNNTTEVMRQVASKSDAVRKLLDDVSNYEHSVAVTTLAGLLLKHIGGDNAAIFNAVGLACFFHDASLAGFPPEVLEGDASGLTPEQKQAYDNHPEESAKIVRKIKSVPPLVAAAVAQHHLRMNKQGFPKEKAVTEVNRIAELIGLCEEYLILARRQKSDPNVDPFGELRARAAKEFSAPLVDAFVRTFTEK